MTNNADSALQPDDAFIQDLIACKSSLRVETESENDPQPNDARQRDARKKVRGLLEARQKEVRRKAERQEEQRLNELQLEEARQNEVRLEAERLEFERLEAERLEAERLETERLEVERETERFETERLDEERFQKGNLQTERPLEEQSPEEQPQQEQLIEPTITERRRTARYDITLPVACYPMLPSLEVDPGRMINGIVVDISASGISVILETQHIEVGQLLVLAVESDNLGWRFADAKVVGVRPCRDRSTHIQCSLNGPLKRVFADDQLLPKLDPKSFKYVFPIDDGVLVSLCAIGALQRIQLDEVLVCPDCLSVPTVRKGCSICLSNETEKATMIHHFACAHVDFKDAFDQGDEIMCPKCLGRKMIIGADYEYLNGPTRCRECGHNDLEEILIGHCMACSNRFPFENAHSIEITGYRVNRLEPLAIISNN